MEYNTSVQYPTMSTSVGMTHTADDRKRITSGVAVLGWTLTDRVRSFEVLEEGRIVK